MDIYWRKVSTDVKAMYRFGRLELYWDLCLVDDVQSCVKFSDCIKKLSLDTVYVESN